MRMLDFLIIIVAVLAVFRASTRNLSKGFLLAVTFFVLLPPEVKIPSPGGLPEITVQRIILMGICALWYSSNKFSVVGTPFKRFLYVLLFLRFISVVLSITPAASIKEWLSFAFEGVIFYFIVSSVLNTAQMRIAAMKALLRGFVVVAAIGWIERYWEVSIPALVISNFGFVDGIQATFRHRILFGYAMAMAMPLALVLLDFASGTRERLFLWVSLALIVAACFFADSRGGWIGMGIGGMLSMVLGSKRTRKRCIFLLSLAAIVVLVRPGVRQTILDRFDATFDEGSYKNESYSYRWKLWHVAYSEIQKSPERFLFGYGGLSTESMDLSRYFKPEEGGTTAKIGFTSWDNQYACDLIEYGMIGFIAECAFYFCVMISLIKRWLKADAEARGSLAALIAAVTVFIFAQSNVWIFSIQLKFFLWCSLGLAWGGGKIMEKSAISKPSHQEDCVFGTAGANA
jgi:O-antigen ligase